MTSEERFDRDIPQIQADYVLTIISESAHDDDANECVTITGRDRHDAINVTAEGRITVNCIEYEFIVQDGNRNGTVLLSWDDDKVMEVPEPTRYALRPTHNFGNARQTLSTWNALLKKEDVSSIPGKYAYDSYVQPGYQTNDFWKAEAAKHGLEICTQEDADSYRREMNRRAFGEKKIAEDRRSSMPSTSDMMRDLLESDIMKDWMQHF